MRPAVRRPRRALLAAALALVLPIAPVCHAQGEVGDSRVAEYRIKAAFLFKFLPFVEWPPQAFARADSPLVIGVLGAGTLADELETIVAKRLVNERPAEVRRLRKGDTATDVHVVFVARPQHTALASIVAANRGRPLLTVGEQDDADNPGTAINFVVVDDRVRFDVALRAAEAGQVSISSRLLALARRVVPGTS